MTDPNAPEWERAILEKVALKESGQDGPQMGTAPEELTEEEFENY